MSHVLTFGLEKQKTFFMSSAQRLAVDVGEMAAPAIRSSSNTNPRHVAFFNITPLG
jgi:hypothetical protein